MAGMQFVGVPERAKQARAALNRLRWEIDWAITNDCVSDALTIDLAEAIGIFTNIVKLLGDAVPAEPPSDDLEELLGTARQRFLNHVEFFTKFHHTAR